MKSLVQNLKRHIYIPLCGLIAFSLLFQLTVLIRGRVTDDSADLWLDLHVRSISGNLDAVPFLTPDDVADLLVQSIIQIESSGDPTQIGAAGERGLMQIMPGTWDDMTRRAFGHAVSFDRAFEPELNELIGRHYLAYLQDFLQQHRSAWRADERALLLACYNGGLGRVMAAGFDIRQLPRSVQDYVARGSALHDALMTDQSGSELDQHAGQSSGNMRVGPEI